MVECPHATYSDVVSLAVLRTITEQIMTFYHSRVCLCVRVKRSSQFSPGEIVATNN